MLCAQAALRCTGKVTVRGVRVQVSRGGFEVKLYVTVSEATGIGKGVGLGLGWCNVHIA